MGKIFKNMLPYWKWILVIVAFLVMQAFCDLSLPQYTSDIIDVGIMSSGVEHILPEEMTQEAAEAARAEAEEILAQAKAEAEEILAQAQAQAGQIREEAKKEGFNSGTIESERQLTEKKQELEQQHAQLVKQLEEDYEQRRNDMEPQIVEALLAVFTEVTHTVSEDNKEIVLHLINNVLKNVENSHSYSIKVSPDDYNFVLNNQGKIYCAMNNEVNLDIVQDMALKQNECMIETDSGVFNCSLDVELHNLIKQIKLLSCM